MNILTKGTLTFGMVLCLAPAGALLHDDQCLANIQAAIQTASEMCANVPVNQVCYGSGEITIEPRDNVRLVFSEPSDRVDAALLSELYLSGDPATYSVSVIRPRANLPNGALTMIAFGNVRLRNSSTISSEYVALPLHVTAPTGANVRSEPAPDAELLEQLSPGVEVLADGISPDGRWIHRYPSGWIARELLDDSAYVQLLQVISDKPQYVDLLNGYPFVPMQLIVLRSDIDDAPCTGAPDSGLIFQTPDVMPDDISTARLWVSGVNIYFHGTIFVQGDDEQELILSVLEGWARAAIPFNGRELTSGERLVYAPGEAFPQAEPYHYTRARNLPLALLPREIELPFSTGGLITPFEPGTGFLNSTPPDGVCTVAWTVDVNLRAGPGTDYPIRQGIGSGYYGQPDARAVGTDGRLWWRLADAIWLAADNTVAAGACGALALVEAPPLPVETDADV
jgi:hypothetical protein